MDTKLLVHIHEDTKLDWITVCCYYVEKMFSAKLANKKKRRHKYLTSVFLLLATERHNDHYLVHHKTSEIPLSHNLTNNNSQWLRELALGYKINTDRHFINFTNIYYPDITTIHSTLLLCTFCSLPVQSSTQPYTILSGLKCKRWAELSKYTIPIYG
jgi:hypothetical protein